MTIVLRAGEDLKIKANFHWSSYLFPGIWAVLGTLGILGSSNQNENSSPVLMLFIFLSPLLYIILANRCKDFSLTNQRLYIEKGIIAKSKKDIPLQKINDIEVSQGIIQRMLGSGNIIVLTGNDKRTKLSNINNPEIFKNQISSMTQQAIHKS